MAFFQYIYSIATSVVTAIQVRITNFLFDLFWKYNYAMIQIEGSRIGQIWKPADTRLVEPPLDSWTCVASIENGRLLERYVYGDLDSEKDAGSVTIWKTPESRRVNTAHNVDDAPKGDASSNPLKKGSHPKGVSLFDNNVGPSRVSFLSVHYEHPDLPNGLRLIIDPQYMMVGNHLLDRVFVLRLLSYQYNRGNYVFDDRYSLKIMDSNINICTVRSDQGVVVGEKEYAVV
jgi:hypothetical protein